ncbi:hypothetical protein B7463_g11447, partial [Scytalidium lignicola]
MLLPGDKLANRPSLRKTLPKREPVNTKAPGQDKIKNVPPGLANNKNGPPGLEGNQKGPVKAILSTHQESALATSQTNPPPAPPPATSTSLITTTSTGFLSSTSSTFVSSVTALSTSSDLIIATSTNSLSSTSSPILDSSATTLSTSFQISSVPLRLSVLSFASTGSSALPDPVVSGTGTIASIPAATKVTTGFLTSESSTKSLIISNIMQTTVMGVSSATGSAPTGMFNSSQYDVTQPEHTPISPSHTAAIVVGAIAGFAFILTLKILLFKWRRRGFPNVLPRFVQHPRDEWKKIPWFPRSKTPDQTSQSLLSSAANSNDNPAWDYEATFAKPTVFEKAKRSFRKSLTALHLNGPLNQNAVKSNFPDARSPSSKSFTLFHRHVDTSIHRKTLNPDSLQDKSGPPSTPKSPVTFPPYGTALILPPLSTAPVHLRGLAQDETDTFQPPITTPVLVASQGFQFPWNHRNSQMTEASAKSQARSARSLPSWAKFYYSDIFHADQKLPNRSEKELPQLPTPISPALWLKAKLLYRPHSISTSTYESELSKGSGDDDVLLRIEQGALRQV